MVQGVKTPKTDKMRERCRLTQISLKGGPLESYAVSNGPSVKLTCAPKSNKL